MDQTKNIPPVYNSWVSCPKPNPQARWRLFCFPYAGSTVSVFHPWSKLLPTDVELFLVHLPGRASRLREVPFIHLPTLIDALTSALTAYFNKPFAFFGHSMGALIAFELARQLRRCNAQPPVHLFVSGRRAPQLPDPLPLLHQLPDDIFLQELQHRYDGLPDIILKDPELLDLFLPIVRADLTLIETYSYTSDAPLECPISAFGGWDDHTLTTSELTAWQEQTLSTFNHQMFDGDHFYLQKKPVALIHSLIRNLTLTKF